MSASRWESLLWPRWLPETARLPVVAQVTGAVALTALIMGPWWSGLDTPTAPSHSAALSGSPVPTPSPASTAPQRPAHLNLDVRHSLASVALLVTVDGNRALQTTLEGNGKKFKMFGKRAERHFTRTLDLEPGVRVVRVRIQSTEDRFDQTRVERFDVAPASVAALRISADKSTGLVAVADNPASTSDPRQAPAPQPAVAASVVPAQTGSVPPHSITLQADALAKLLNSLRSMLIAIAGFVASAATGFMVQEFLRSKKGAIFKTGEQADADGSRRRRSHSQTTTTAAVD